uniref:Uncharacterized protein n=1 Tax=Nelumbo nucifera TaxID=4432 RepID=A0A822Z8W9_NELNU|nr:TPA_asm: hypothetical protein HUJ06_015353 [Nelumbo nucifera]
MSNYHFGHHAAVLMHIGFIACFQLQYLFGNK